MHAQLGSHCLLDTRRPANSGGFWFRPTGAKTRRGETTPCNVCDRVLAADHVAARGAKRSPRRDDRFRRGAATSILLTTASDTILLRSGQRCIAAGDERPESRGRAPLADECFRDPKRSDRTSPLATERSSRFDPTCAAAGDRFRPEGAVPADAAGRSHSTASNRPTPTVRAIALIVPPAPVARLQWRRWGRPRPTSPSEARTFARSPERSRATAPFQWRNRSPAWPLVRHDRSLRSCAIVSLLRSGVGWTEAAVQALLVPVSGFRRCRRAVRGR
jgi:hypothetical protein